MTTYAVDDVRTLTAQGLSARQIADRLGVSPRTVVRYRTTPEDTMYAPDTLQPDHGWRAQALCTETDPTVFFPEKNQSAARAKEICKLCPVMAECLEAAMAEEKNSDQHHRAGVRGGLSTRQRSGLAKRRRAAAKKAAESETPVAV